MNALQVLFVRGAVGRAALSSLLATACDYAVFSMLVSLQVHAGVATLAGCLVGGLLNFTVNRCWVFGAGGPLTTALLRYAAVSGSSGVSNSILVAVLTSLVGLSATAAWLLARSLVFLSLTYPLFRTWVFGAPRTLDLASTARGVSS
jgi:putative flippase GtrA